MLRKIGIIGLAAVLCAALTGCGKRFDDTLPENPAIFQNKIVRFLSSVSMEIYLCHMFVFRALEKMKLLHLTGNEILNYLMVGISTIFGAIVMSLILKKLIEMVTKKLVNA